jgi:hypothetical protein
MPLNPREWRALLKPALAKYPKGVWGFDQDGKTLTVLMPPHSQDVYEFTPSKNAAETAAKTLTERLKLRPPLADSVKRAKQLANAQRSR